ncbi:MAG TPA: AgmX/PglI C-terminal domain-containing protein, partial [Polyangiaceae bacterium]|nr:AgmX/PglI C-terminal domain-containing protein [Polyangiaceae bacterium]
RLEDAIRQVETGKNLDGARKSLEALLQDPSLTASAKDDARLALSRALELQGDREGAIVQVETLLGSHPGSKHFESRSTAERRLSKLLNNDDREPRQPTREEQVAPMAGVLSKFFPPAANGSYSVRILVFGRPPESSETLGTFNIAGAIRRAAEDACPLCENKVRMDNTHSGFSSWTSLPMVLAASSSDNPSLADSLTVFYFDLEQLRVPGRYDRYLPLAADQIASYLHPEQGVVVAKLRENAPPIIVIAAPRWGLLSEVERAFSEMTELPTEPKPIALTHGLRSSEIRNTIRAAYPSLRQCYEKHLEKSPEAAGKFIVGFEIDDRGAVGMARMEPNSTLTDAELQQCFLGVVRGLSFPAVGGKTTVTYPIELRPNRATN